MRSDRTVRFWRPPKSWRPRTSQESAPAQLCHAFSVAATARLFFPLNDAVTPKPTISDVSREIARFPHGLFRQWSRLRSRSVGSAPQSSVFADDGGVRQLAVRGLRAAPS